MIEAVQQSSHIAEVAAATGAAIVTLHIPPILDNCRNRTLVKEMATLSRVTKSSSIISSGFIYVNFLIIFSTYN